MSFLGKIGLLSPESQALEGEPDEVDAKRRAAHDEKLMPARVQAARRISGWQEIDDDLVARGHGWFESACSDRIYAPYRGAVWVADSVVPLTETAELAFTVDGDELRFYERVHSMRTWSEHIQRQTAKQLQKRPESP